MNFIKQIERLQKLNKLLCQQCTGSPDELAERLNLKRSQLYEVLDQLKILGAPIAYSRKRSTFFYSKDFNFEIVLKVKVLTGTEVISIYGGEVINFRYKILLSEESGRSKFNLPLQTYTSCVCR